MPSDAELDVDRVVKSIMHHYATREDARKRFRGERQGRLMREFSGACVRPPFHPRRTHRDDA